MAVLLEFKEKFRRFYNKYDTYLVPALKFIVALVSFIMLNASIGYVHFYRLVLLLLCYHCLW